jgi:hypothetical protein
MGSMGHLNEFPLNGAEAGVHNKSGEKGKGGLIMMTSEIWIVSKLPRQIMVDVRGFNYNYRHNKARDQRHIKNQ